jgi:hypothetical protein
MANLVVMFFHIEHPKKLRRFFLKFHLGNQTRSSTMNQQIKARWIEALRSGKYGQTTSHLSDKEGFCCLGVLCDLYIQDHPTTSEWRQYEEDSPFNVFACNINTDNRQSNHEVLPYEVAKWAGFDKEETYPTAIKMTTGDTINCDVVVRSADLCDDLPIVSGRSELRDKKQVSLAELNDEYRFSFEALAHIIEKQL